ncbi:MAG: prenyltransferase/squalene oxidase repeat-containing protein [Solirubrobacterales bacterium]
MSWQAASFTILGLALLGGFVWFERSRPPARLVAAVAAMAALGVAGRLALAPIPNVVATTDVALLAGYALGGAPGVAVGALSGLVSNFWLGQGPWTPWQMAGWGMVGIAGAVLARASGRRMSRLGLACVGALAGFAYGALLDLSVMIEFGGEQSLDRYLALSARGLPFNIAHAAGNFVLMLAAGPALVRMLDRYRDRFAYRWSDSPLGRSVASLALVACLLTPLLSPDRGAAAQGRDGARSWLISAQNDDGGYGTGPDVDSATDMTGWAMVGLAAAGVNPRDVATGGNTPVEYLRKSIDDISSIGDLELTILGLEASGLDSRAFQGRDLVAELRSKERDDGSYQGQVNLTAFAILAQRSAGVEGANVGKPASWLRSVQIRNGGWASVPKGESEPDSTGSVMQALKVAPGAHGPIQDGAKWLERNQHKDGGWSLTEGGTSNSQSTAWAIQGLTAAGISAGTIRNDGNSGIDFLYSRQSSSGYFAYSGSSDQTPVWVTSQALMGVMKVPFPIAAVPREKPDDNGADNDSTGGTSTPPSSSPPTYPTSPSPSLPGGGLDLGGLGGADSGGSNGGGNPGPGGSSPGSGLPDGLPEGELPTGPDDGEDAPLDTFAQSAATPLPELPSQDSPLPGTMVFLAGIGLLAAGLGAGFLHYRRRQL